MPVVFEVLAMEEPRSGSIHCGNCRAVPHCGHKMDQPVPKTPPDVEMPGSLDNHGAGEQISAPSTTHDPSQQPALPARHRDGGESFVPDPFVLSARVFSSSTFPLGTPRSF